VILARVIGNVIATRKHDTFHSFKMMVVRPLEAGSGGEEDFIAVDSVGAGPGETVLVVVEGRSAGQAVGGTSVPLDAAIVGIVDRIDRGAEA
jgi:microcompartment protein CcmK/EutM